MRRTSGLYQDNGGKVFPLTGLFQSLRMVVIEYDFILKLRHYVSCSELRKEIAEFELEIFDEEERFEIQEIISAYRGSKKQFELALGRLQYIIPSRPKRPLYYVYIDIDDLPKLSRHLVEQSGSYVDLLLKEYRFELEGKYFGLPLGKTVEAITKLMKNSNDKLSSLLNHLLRFNEIIYVPSKHVYGPPDDEGHYFAIDDAIVSILIAVKLGEEIKMRSQFARNLAQDLVLPSQKPYIGKHREPDGDGIPINFKKRLLESKAIQ